MRRNDGQLRSTASNVDVEEKKEVERQSKKDSGEKSRAMEMRDRERKMEVM